MNLRPPEENHGDDRTLQEALSTAAALAAAAMEDIAARETTTESAVPGSIPVVSIPAPTPSAAVPSLPTAPTTCEGSSAAPIFSPNTTTSTATLPVMVPFPVAQPPVIHPHNYVPYSNPGKPQQLLVQPPGPQLVPIILQPNAGFVDTIKLRRGKWTADEEAYAEFLIKEFERGTVEGCENGCTLRSFLSKKLHCAPMRISKKYAGKSIGKHVFLSRASAPSSTVTLGETCNKARLLELETNFYKSLQRESEATVPYLTPFSAGGMLLPVPSQPCVQQTNQLHQTFMSALHSQKAVSVVAPPPILPAPPVVSPPSSLRIPSGLPTAEQLAAPTQGLVALPIAPRQQTPQPDQRQSWPKPLQHDLPLVTRSATPNPDVASSSTELPDFLSGFEKVTAQNAEAVDTDHPTNIVRRSSSASGQGLSPRPLRLTFPEFPPLPSAITAPAVGQKSAATTSQSLLGGSVPVGSVTADSYAVFAQESALAVSQHSAYFGDANGRSAVNFPCDEPSLTPAVVNAENLRAHSMVTDNSNFISGSDNLSTKWEAFNVMGESIGVVSGSDNSSETRSNDADSDSNYDEGPEPKKIKVE
ncbi:hypothetical protein MHU86_6800 [Fragilaria crotonensis]|nr:hypothetical protein MHU86_6800 [Fragilaria crotonensis]